MRNAQELESEDKMMKTIDMYQAERMMYRKAYVAGDFDPAVKLMRKITGDDEYYKHSYLGIKAKKGKGKKNHAFW